MLFKTYERYTTIFQKPKTLLAGFLFRLALRSSAMKDLLVFLSSKYDVPINIEMGFRLP